MASANERLIDWTESPQAILQLQYGAAMGHAGSAAALGSQAAAAAAAAQLQGGNSIGSGCFSCQFLGHF